jgi:hypothetical protein
VATVIDSLIVTLGVDSTGFNKGEKDATKKVKVLQDSAKKAGAEFKSLGLSMLGVLGIAVSFGAAANQFKNFVVQVTGADAATGRTAKNMGLLVKELSAWQKLSEKFGSSSEDITGNFGNAARIAFEMQKGGSAASGPLGMLLGNNLTPFTQMGMSNNIQGMMELLQAAVAKSTKPSYDLGFFKEAGFSEGAFTMFRELGDQLRVQLDLQKKNNAAGEEDAKQAAERLAAWSRFNDALEAAGRGLMNLFKLTELLDKATRKLQSYVNGESSPKEDIKNAVRDTLLPPALAKRIPSGQLGLDTIGGSIWDEIFAPGAFVRWGLMKDKNSRYAPGAIGSLQQAAGQAAAGGESFKFGTDAFSRMLAVDIRGGATFSPGVLDQLTSLARRGGAASAPGVTTITNNIDKIEVQTQATDAAGISKSLRDAMQRDQRLFSAQGNAGQR